MASRGAGHDGNWHSFGGNRSESGSSTSRGVGNSAGASRSGQNSAHADGAWHSFGSRGSAGEASGGSRSFAGPGTGSGAHSFEGVSGSGHSSGFSNPGLSHSLGSRSGSSSTSAFGNHTFSNSQFGSRNTFGGSGFGNHGFGWHGNNFGHGWGCCGFGGFGFGFGFGFGWGGWWNPWFWGPGWGWWGTPYAYYSPWWGGPPYGYTAYPSYNYGAPYNAPDQPSNDDSLYGPYYSGGASDYQSAPLSEGTPDTDPITANVAVSAPSILLYLNDGTMLVASDYWLAGGQLHYTVKYGGESTIDVNQVDMRRTTDENAKRGVRFQLKASPSLNPNGMAENRFGAASSPASIAAAASI
jgi:hypothetical protein